MLEGKWFRWEEREELEAQLEKMIGLQKERNEEEDLG